MKAQPCRGVLPQKIFKFGGSKTPLSALVMRYVSENRPWIWKCHTIASHYNQNNRVWRKQIRSQTWFVWLNRSRGGGGTQPLTLLKHVKKILFFFPWNKQCAKNYIYFSDCSKFIVAVKYLGLKKFVQINRHLQACQRIAQVTKFEWQTGCDPAVAIHNHILSQNLIGSSCGED